MLDSDTDLWIKVIKVCVCRCGVFLDQQTYILLTVNHYNNNFFSAETSEISQTTEESVLKKQTNAQDTYSQEHQEHQRRLPPPY